MSNYPEWWDTSLTIYNRFVDPETDVVTWYRHNLENCFWKHNVDRVALGQTVIESNNVLCRIPVNDSFLEKYEWISIPNDEMSNYFTLGVGDIIVKGSITDDIDEYEKGHRSTDLMARYKDLQGCIQIQQVRINVGAGRCLPHYYIKGE